MAESGIYINQIEVGLMQNFSYLVGCVKTGECALIDPAWEPDRLLKAVEEKGMKLAAVLLTHTHFDHMEGLEGLFRLAGPRKIYVHEAEAMGVEQFREQVEAIKDGSQISLGALSIQCIHTPGHLPGCVCYRVGKSLFTGDTLFVNSVGRTDFPGSNPGEFYRSLNKLKTLEDDVIVYPGHDYGPTPTSTIGLQKKENPYLMMSESPASF